MRCSLAYGKTGVAVMAMFCLATATNGQLSPSNTILTLSEPVRTTYYPEVICPHCILPHWDRDGLLQVELEKDPALVRMFNRDGTKVLEAHFKPRDAVSASVANVGVTHSGGILAVGGLTIRDGSLRQFIAKTDAAGHVVQWVTTKGAFSFRQVCEAPDGTIWTLGYERDSQSSPEAGKNILRHFSKEGMVASYISLTSIGDGADSVSQIASAGRSYLHCSTDRVSLYLGAAALYVEVDVISGNVTRWKVDMSSAVGSQTTGFAVTEEGRIFVALANAPEPGGEHKYELYELVAPASSTLASLAPVQGTLAVFPRSERVPEGTYVRLWGADRNDLVVSRGDDWGLSWVKVLVSKN